MTATPPPTSARKLSALALVGISLAGLLVVALLCGGVGLALGLPAYLGFVRRSKAAEARANLRMLEVGIAAYALGEAVDPATARLGTRGLPPSVALTPSTVGSERQAWPANADPMWEELGFATFDPLYYAYEVVTDRAANTVTVRAVGDLDGDGVTSEYLAHGLYDPQSGEITWDSELTVTNELE